METLATISVVLAGAWLLAAGFTWRGGRRPTAAWCAALAVLHLLAAAEVGLAPLVVAGWLGFGLSVPTGRLGSRPRALLALGGAAALGAWSAGLLVGGREPAFGALAAAVLVVVVVCGVAVTLRWGRTGAPGRRTLQWLTAAVVVGAALDVVVLSLHVLIGSPVSLEEPLLASLLLVPVAQALLTRSPSARSADAVLIHAVVLAGLSGLVVMVYLVVVVGLGRPPVGGERDVMLLSLVAAVVVAALAFPVQQRLRSLGAALVGGPGPDADGVLSTFGSRMSRAVPMDELLLQLAESLRATMAPAGAEVWLTSDGALRRAVSVPNRPPARLALDEQARVVVGRARLGGHAWTAMWLPDLPDRAGSDEEDLRVAPVAHLGELLGLLVVRRGALDPFSEDEERLLVELARQVGLALHNVRLDSALQASLAELEERNAELLASRLRIVAASDEARRAIERNLHDGAQQQLVALAVQLSLAAQIAPEEPESIPGVLENLRTEVQSTIRELRELAHGIYPPLLRDRGLGEALRAAANRSPLPCRVEVDLPGRYPLDVETAAYFCCLEALQNAGKYAGPGASVTVRLGQDGSRLWFEVADDGVGLDPGAGEGHGFVNMRDRLGALGGELTVLAEPAGGTVVRGSIPAVAPAVVDSPVRA